MSKTPIKISSKEIIEYWSNIIDEQDIGVDWSDANDRCWRCARKRKTLERCHIIPEFLGGKVEVENLILLCKDCHKESPDVTNKQVIWDWIKRTKADYYDLWDMQKGLEVYQEVYGESFEKTMRNAIPEYVKKNEAFHDIIVSLWKEALIPAFNISSTHFGVGYSSGTRAFIFREAADSISSFFKGNIIKCDKDGKVSSRKSIISKMKKFLNEKYQPKSERSHI